MQDWKQFICRTQHINQDQDAQPRCFAHLYYSLFLPYKDIKATTQAANYYAPASCSKFLDAHGRRTRAATTRHPAARALRQPCRAPRVLVSRPQRLYIDYAVRRHDVIFWAYDYFDYSSRLVSTRKLVEDGSRDINN
jgi:hypothetical protein